MSDSSGGVTGPTVLAVLAHPDDESLACGGTLARLSDAGVRVVLVCASRGENGSVSDPALVPDGDLGTVRAGELEAAAKVLGIAEVIMCDQPDGDLRWARIHYLHLQIVIAIRRSRPDAVITFAEDGLYWHLDHIGVHERTTTAVKSLGAAAPPLYYVTMPHGIMRELVDAALAAGLASSGASFWGIAPEVFGKAAIMPTLTVDVRDWVPRKLAALRCHRTQMGPTNPLTRLDAAGALRCLGVEHFRRAPGSSPAAVLESIGGPIVSS